MANPYIRWDVTGRLNQTGWNARHPDSEYRMAVEKGKFVPHRSEKAKFLAIVGEGMPPEMLKLISKDINNWTEFKETIENRLFFPLSLENK